MALPIVLPIAAEGAAALAGALGLTAAAGLATSKPSWYKPEPLPISAQQKLELAKFLATHGLPKETNVVSIPSADNALVLRPEYRTEVSPVTYDDFIMESRLGDAWGVLRGKKKVAETKPESNGSEQKGKKSNGTKKPDDTKKSNTPKEEPKEDPKWKKGPITSSLKFLRDYWQYPVAAEALSEYAKHKGWINRSIGDWIFTSNKESSNKEESDDIQLTDADLEWARQFTK